LGEREKRRERERDRMVQRVQRTATTSTHTYMHTLFQSCHLQRHVSKVRFPFSFIHSFMQVNDKFITTVVSRREKPIVQPKRVIERKSRANNAARGVGHS